MNHNFLKTELSKKNEYQLPTVYDIHEVDEALDHQPLDIIYNQKKIPSVNENDINIQIKAKRLQYYQIYCETYYFKSSISNNKKE